MMKQDMTENNTKRSVNWSRVLAGALAALLALLMAVSVFSGMFSASAVTQAEVDALKKQLSQATAQKKALKNELNNLASDLNSVERQMSALDEQIDVAKEEIELQDQLLAQLANLISEKELELQVSTEKEQQQYANMKERIRFMVEHGSVSYLSVLLSAEDFADFLNRYEIVSQISGRDKVLFENLKQTRQLVEEQKADLEQTRAEEEATRSDMESNKRSLEQQMSEKETRMHQLENSQAETKEAYAAMIEKEDALIEKVRQKAAELAAQQTYTGGTFMWPLPAANNVVTCPYGMRTHPITGVYKLHTGVDLRAKSGTKIFATNGGTIVTSAYSSAWGNYVVINHGGGYTSLYAHMSKRAVSEGQKVSRGDVIGYVGNTGYSTAPHLHFEISQNGKTGDPLNHFKGFNVIYK